MSALVISSGGSSSTTVTFNTVAPSLSNGQTAPLQGDTSANLLVSINALGGAKGQQAMASSFPVVLASNQTAIPINLQDGSGNSITKGQKQMVNSLPVALASDQGSIPVSISDTSGNGIVVGQKAMVSSVPVVIASDQTKIPINLNDSAGAAITRGQQTMAFSLPVALASNQSSLPTAEQYLSVKNEMDTSLLDASVTTINGSAGAFVQVVASLGNACKKIRIADTTGNFIGVYTGAAASETFAFMINPGLDDYIEHSIAAATRITLRSMTTSSITVGNLAMQFTG